MNGRNRSYRVEPARPEHDAGMARLLEESAFDGPVSVSYRRRPSVIASYEKESEEALLYVLIDENTETVAGMGAVTIRPVRLNRKITRVAYLSGLRITPSHQKAFLLIPRMYERMYQTTKDRVDVYLTTIVEDNADAVRMFEKKRRGMPEYRFDTVLETFLLGTKKSRNAETVKPATQADGAPADLSVLETLGAAFYGTSDACGYLVKPSWKQYHIAGYRGLHRLLPYLPTRILGWPRFPKAGTDADYFAAGLYGEENIPERVETLRRQTDGADFLMLSARSNTPLAAHCRTLTPAVYRTRLYQVLFHGAEPLDLSRMAVDVLFL